MNSIGLKCDEPKLSKPKSCLPFQFALVRCDGPIRLAGAVEISGVKLGLNYRPNRLDAAQGQRVVRLGHERIRCLLFTALRRENQAAERCVVRKAFEERLACAAGRKFDLEGTGRMQLEEVVRLNGPLAVRDSMALLEPVPSVCVEAQVTEPVLHSLLVRQGGHFKATQDVCQCLIRGCQE